MHGVILDDALFTSLRGNDPGGDSNSLLSYTVSASIKRTLKSASRGSHYRVIVDELPLDFSYGVASSDLTLIASAALSSVATSKWLTQHWNLFGNVGLGMSSTAGILSLMKTLI